jgi:predicted nucleic acid-binding protein
VALALVDSSAIVAYIVDGDALHKDAVDAVESAVRNGRPLSMSVVTWSEVLHGALLGYYPENAIREFAEDFGIAVVPVDVEVAEQAAALQAAYRETSMHKPRPRLRTPDALILATSVVHESIDTVICGDEKWAKVPGVNGDIVLLAERS